MSTTKRIIAIYWQQARYYKKYFITAIIFIPISGLLIDTLVPYALSLAVAGLTAHQVTTIYQALLLGGLFIAGGVVTNTIGFHSLTHFESLARQRLSKRVTRQLLGKDFSFFANHQTGALAGNANDFIVAQVQLTDLLIMDTLRFSLSVGIGLTIVAIQNIPLAGFLLLTIGLLLLHVRTGMKRRTPYRTKKKKLQSKLYGRLADAISNNQTVKVFAGEDFETKQYVMLRQRFEKAFMKDSLILTNQGTVRITFMSIMQLATVALMAYLVFHGQLSLAIAIFTLTYLQRLSSQIFSLGDLVNGYDRALLAATPMAEILSQPETVTDQPDALTLQYVTPTIDFNHVSLAYSDTNRPALVDLSLTIPAGQKVGLVGKSGAGKTTITHLLLRFMDVTTGSIKIDGHDIRQVNQQSLRQSIAYVPQEPILFHRSLRDNISYGHPTASDDEIYQAAKQANALEFIETLPNGFDTLVGERGIKLSGGQRQRIAIARAILKNAPILLLDEATSALDSESEALIQQSLKQLVKGRTSIVIAHRLSTIAALDRIIVLDEGHIAEDGSHQELLAKNGLYAKLWKRQSGGFIDESE